MEDFKLIVVVVFASLSFSVKAQNINDNTLASAIDPGEAFINPPKSAKSGVLLMWIGLNSSREGITNDLEALKEVHETADHLVEKVAPWSEKQLLISDEIGKKLSNSSYTSSAEKQLINASLYHSIRGGLKNSFLKFSKKKIGRVAFLGGSITENPGWRDSICHYLQERFLDTKFDFVPAGISSTGSIPGAFRLQEDLLSKGTIDLLFEEAAVNDYYNGFDDKAQIRGMEGIVRHARLANPEMDIVLMYFVDPDKIASYNKGVIPAEVRNHDSVATHYNLPAVNLAREVTDRINAGEFTWDHDFKDLHPSPFGQGIYYYSIKKLLDDCWKTVDLNSSPVAYSLPEPIDQSSYFSGSYVDIRKAKIINNWTLINNWKPDDGTGTRKGFSGVPMLIAEVPGAELKFSFKGTAVGICVATGQDAGVIEYSVDGNPYKKLDLFTKWSKSVHLPWYYVLESEMPAGRHTVRIRISESKNAESNGHACRIVHFLLNSLNWL